MAEFHFPPAVWLVTFLVHSTVLLGLAWLIDRFRLLRSPAAREHLWRAALFGALATATLQSAGIVERVRLGALFGPAAHAPAPSALRAVETGAPAHAAAAPAPAAPRPALILGNWPGSVARALGETGSGLSPVRPNGGALVPGYGREALRPGPDAQVPAVEGIAAAVGGARTSEGGQLSMQPAAEAVRSSFAARWPDWLALLWLCGAACASLRFLALAWQARRELAERAPAGDALTAELGALCAAQRLRTPVLTVARSLAGPISLPNGEIVLPPWAVAALDPRRRRAMLAHELAHHARRDPLWLVGTFALDALLWVQPLIGVARRRLASLAELSADAWAARAVGDPRALAECLAECAEHVHFDRAARFGAALSAESPLVERIDRLLKGNPMQGLRTSASLRVGALATLVAAVFMLPGCSPGDLMASGRRVSTRISVYDDGASSVSVSRPDYWLEMECDGEVTFAADESDVATVEAGCVLELQEKLDGVKRGYEVRSGPAGELSRTFSRDGDAVPDDAESRTWLASALPRMFRESGFDADARVERLLARGGPALVLAEIDLTRGDHGKADYLAMLLSKRSLDSTQLELALAAAGRIDSDFELRRALGSTIETQGLDVPRYVRVLELAGGMGSDYERAEFLTAAAERMPADRDVREAWLAAAARIDGDFDLRRTLETGVDRSRDDAAFLAEVIALAGRELHSDYELRTLLEKVAPRAGDPALAAAYLAAARELDSDFELRTALLALIEETELDSAGKSGVLDAAAELGSDFEKRTVLQALAPAVAADPDLNRRYRELARSMSDFERGSALQSLDDATK